MREFLFKLALLTGTALFGSLYGEQIYDFGKAPPGDPLTHIFSITNTTQRSLKLDSLVISCSCLVVENSPKILEVGQAGRVSIRLYTAGARGKLQETVKLGRTAADFPDFTLSVSALIQAPIEATPDYVRLERTSVGGTNAFTFVDITNHLGIEVMLSQVVSDSERFIARLETVKSGRSYRLRIEALSPFNSGNTFGQISVATSLKSQPKLEVGVFVPAVK